MDNTLLPSEAQQHVSDEPKPPFSRENGLEDQAGSEDTAGPDPHSNDDLLLDEDLDSALPQINLYSKWDAPDIETEDEGMEEPGAGIDREPSDAEATADPRAGQHQEQDEAQLQCEDIVNASPQEQERIANLSVAPAFEEPAKKFLEEGSLPRPRDESASNLQGSEKLGERWRNGMCFTIAQTLVYAVDMEQGQVHGIHCTWDHIHSGFSSEAEAFKMFIQQAGIGAAEQDADWEEDAALMTS